MNSITAIKVAALTDAVKHVFRTSREVGKSVGKSLGSESLGDLAGIAAPILATNYVVNQIPGARRAKVRLGEHLSRHIGGEGGNMAQRALTPSDFGRREGDY
jgi:hypothetical protein